MMSDDIESKVDYCFKAIKAICDHFHIPVLTEEEVQKKNEERRKACIIDLEFQLIQFMRDNNFDCKFVTKGDLRFDHLHTVYYGKFGKTLFKGGKDSDCVIFSIPPGEYSLSITEFQTHPNGYTPTPDVCITGKDRLIIICDALSYICNGIFDEIVTVSNHAGKEFIPCHTKSSDKTALWVEQTNSSEKAGIENRQR